MPNRISEYDKLPTLSVQAAKNSSWQGWTEILDHIRSQVSRGARCFAIECYPGVFEDELAAVLDESLKPIQVLRVRDCYKSPSEIEGITSRELTDDPVFGRLSELQIEDFVDPSRAAALRELLTQNRNRVSVIVGTGTSLIEANPDILIYADLPRWEIQKRQRGKKALNLGVDNGGDAAGLRYKRGYFVDWRVADRIKRKLLDKIHFLLDTTDSHTPKMITGDAFRAALRLAITGPFRVVPFFDPGPWGGHWMRRICNLDGEAPNYAWCFDCVPEENSLRFQFGDVVVEVPALDLVLQHPRELLGEAVYARFGAEFPIRFDFLDTMGGGNLSLQVHPLTRYIKEKFGIPYTQDESYYLLDAAPDACVYLGLKSNVDRRQMETELRRAQEEGKWFDTEKYVNKWPARGHDHFLIPAGTIHCSGRNSMVLEISATPYIFTFKLWDWGRPGLDGKPRPIHLEHGFANIQWDRDTDWVKENLINRICPIGQGPGWREERTGLHAYEFIETRRHWFEGAVIHENRGSVHVLNLVEGDAAVVESPDHWFEPFVVHYAETFIVPAAVEKYSVRPLLPNTKCATIRASVRIDS
jgi:mannose-6-phosphate isomerase class I